MRFSTAAPLLHVDQPFVLGVNYWPRRKAVYWWSQFEAAEVQEEFGGSTEAPGKPSSVWEWTSYGKQRRQFMAAEEELATYLV